MAAEHHARLSSVSKKNGENGHATLSNRLSRAEYNELRGNGTSEQGSDKISGPFEGNSGRSVLYDTSFDTRICGLTLV